jgi:hypothetical protein
MNYSQIGQDLEVLKFYNNKTDGYFIEIGASNGINLSNTYLLEKDYHWKGICVEPIPKNFELLCKNRPNSLCCDKAVYNESNNNKIIQIPPCTVQNVPIQQWVNFTMSVYGKTLDTYINGKLVKTCILPGIAYVNNALNVYVTPGGGFDGSTSKFSYYPNSLNPEQAWNIYEDGYSGGILSNLTGAYQLNISVLQNGKQEASLTI